MQIPSPLWELPFHALKGVSLILCHRFQFSGERHHFLNCFLLAGLAGFRRAVGGRKLQGSSKEQASGLYCACIVSGAVVHVVRSQLGRLEEVFSLSSREGK